MSFSGSSSAFSLAAKSTIESHFQRCWACDGVALEFLDYAHVVPVHDRHYYLRVLSLLPFEVGSPENGIMLCPVCHRTLDDDLNPGWVFFPSDLTFFIEYELNDRRARLQGEDSRNRQVPDADAYLQYQKDTGAVPAHATEPLYSRHVLWPESVTLAAPYISGEKGWFGHPIAAIRNAWRALGSLGSYQIPRKSRARLRYLLDLYQTPLEDDIPPLPHQPLDKPKPLPDDNAKKEGKRLQGLSRTTRQPVATLASIRTREGAGKRSREERIEDWLQDLVARRPLIRRKSRGSG